MTFREAVSAVLFCAFACSVHSYAQAVPEPSSPPPPAEAHNYPDEGYLSTSRYTSAYFGFCIDLPSDAHLQALPIPAPPDGRIPVLEMSGPGPQHAAISIAAYPVHDKGLQEAKTLLRRQLDQELFVGVEELRSLTKASVGGHPFFTFETRRGLDQHAMFAGELQGYVLLVYVAAHDSKLVQQLESAFNRAKFFTPAESRQVAGADAVPYEGPAIPYHRLKELKDNPPVAKLDPGKIGGNHYANEQLGFEYELPSGWSVGTEAAVVPAVERSRAKVSGKPAMGGSEHDLVQACERTLFSAWRTRPVQGEISYEDFGEVTVSAMSLACFPNVKFPSTIEDRGPVREFLLEFGLTHPIMRDMSGAHAFERAGHVFIVMQGTVAYQVEGDDLSRRVSIAIALTQQRGYLLSFFFAAPHESELRELMNAKTAFASEPAARETKSGVVDSSLSAGKAVEPGGSTASTTAVEPSTPATPVKSDPSANSDQTNSDQVSEGVQPTQTASPRPTLLKPGETMQDQQIQGRPLPKKNPGKP